LQALAERNGITLSIGDVELETLTPEIMKQDGPQPKEVAARIAAHLGHRIPGVRKIEKRIEGQDKTSGILSDLGALVGQLYYRNKSEIDDIISQAISSKFSSHKKRTSNSTSPTGPRVDFGEVGDPPNQQEV
jgi:polyribonucleotide nucleotidyltransferase